MTKAEYITETKRIISPVPMTKEMTALWDGWLSMVDAWVDCEIITQQNVPQYQQWYKAHVWLKVQRADMKLKESINLDLPSDVRFLARRSYEKLNQLMDSFAHVHDWWFARLLENHGEDAAEQTMKMLTQFVTAPRMRWDTVLQGCETIGTKEVVEAFIEAPKIDARSNMTTNQEEQCWRFVTNNPTFTHKEVAKYMFRDWPESKPDQPRGTVYTEMDVKAALANYRSRHGR